MVGELRDAAKGPSAAGVSSERRLAVGDVELPEQPPRAACEVLLLRDLQSGLDAADCKIIVNRTQAAAIDSGKCQRTGAHDESSGRP